MSARNLNFMGKIATLALCVILITATTSCARSVDPDTGMKTSLRDPIEPVNRAIFGFNNALDIVLIEPAARLYNFILPSFARQGVTNFMRNLRAPLIFANNILQGQPKDAGVTVGRFIINTTAGVGGLFDVAGKIDGMGYKPEDLGQTLAVWGMGDGFYLVLPLIGPSTLRDTAGMTAEAYADPLRIWSLKTGHDWMYYTRNVVEGFDNRARLVDAVDDLRRNSLDYYAAVRSAYAQKRQSLIRNESPQSAVSVDIPDYE